MTVYVDNASYVFGRMVMCHMVADTEHELHAMAAAIGVSRHHYQVGHYDICLSKKELAVENGAKRITEREAVLVRRRMK